MQVHEIEHRYRKGHTNKNEWSCSCGRTKRNRTVSKGYRTAVEHLEETRTGSSIQHRIRQPV